MATENQNGRMQPDYDKFLLWELYSEDLATEFQQLLDEGADVEQYRELFESVRKMKRGELKSRMADVLFELGQSAPRREGYAYNEPSDLEEIRALRKPHPIHAKGVADEEWREKIAGAWYGRIAGCLLGKPIEGIRTDELDKLLKTSGNYPLHRYILRTDITQDMIDNFRYGILSRECFADMVPCAPVDDDTNYTVMYQLIIDKYGRDFTPHNVARAWTDMQPKNAYCTAERVAFRNFIQGYMPPVSAAYKNPFREWIGAQIRGDYFGYINPGDPQLAAEMAWRDASISHTKNGIYGEMFASAMIAAAAVCDSVEEIIEAGLAEIPATSRLYEAVQNILAAHRKGTPQEEVFKGIHTRWNEFSDHHWCHTISNAEIVAAALLYGENDFSRSICMAVQTGFDTDCNGATVGSILGIKNGLKAIPEEWTAPIQGKLETSIFGVSMVSIDSAVEKTLEHMKKG